ncbi:MAG: hypothetical protein ACPGUV_04995 [Polyangiales bacterium]
MPLLLTLRLAKWLAVLLFVSGAVGGVFCRDFAERRRFIYCLAGPGLGLSWLVGFALLFALGRSPLQGWVLGALALSLLSLQGLLFIAGKPCRRSLVSSLVVLLPLVGTVALMVWR